MAPATQAKAGPLVSVLVPVRDAEAHLDEALASMASQTLRDFEVIVVDDGSTDATPQVAGRWAERDGRFRLLRQPPEGIVAALEHARSEARGDFIARMDGDDVSEPRRLEAQWELLRNAPELSGCGCRVRYFPDDVVRTGARRYERWINSLLEPHEIEEGIFVECPLAHPTFFVRAGALESVGGYRETQGPEDYELILRMWAAGHRFAKVPEVLLRWREGEDRLSRTDPRYGPDAFLALKVRYLIQTLLSPPRRVVIWGAGPVGKTLARALQAEGVGVRAFVDLDPRKIGQEIHGAPVLETSEALALGAASEGRDSGPLHLAAVGQVGARKRITALLRSAGIEPLKGFVAVA